MHNFCNSKLKVPKINETQLDIFGRLTMQWFRKLIISLAKPIQRSLQGIALLFIFFFGIANAAELEILVHPESMVPPAAYVSCTTNALAQCTSSLTEAISLIQNQKWQDSLNNRFSLVKVRLADGIYRLSQPIVLRWGAGATRDIRLEISGVGTQAVISGAVVVKNWTLATESDLPERVAAKARGNLWVADVSALGLPVDNLPPSRGRAAFTELYVGNLLQPVAAWPNIGYGSLLRPPGLPVDEKNTFAVVGRNVSDWKDEPDLQVLAWWHADWNAQTILVDTKDIASNEMLLSEKGSYYGFKSGQRLRVLNALSELDSVGEWYLNRATSKLYYWPDAGFSTKVKELSTAPGLLQIAFSRGVKIHDIAFEKVRGDAVVIDQSSDVELDHVQIRFTGNRAVTVSASTSSGIRDSLIEDNGMGGVLLAGGDRQTLQPASNFVEGNVIRRFSRLLKSYGYGVELSGVGQRVIGNKISNAPHTAIIFTGNDHAIAHNEIFNVVLETMDAGAVYTGRDYTARGTVIENNYFHDIHPTIAFREVKGVYIDDQASGITVRDNLFARVQQPVFIGGGRDNLIENNLFFSCSPAAVHLDSRGANTQRSAILDPNGAFQKALNAVPYRSQVYATRYPNLPKIREDEIGTPKYNVMRNNLIIDGKIINIAPISMRGITLVNNIVATDDAFVDKLLPNARTLPENFRLAPNSLPVKQGFVMPSFGVIVP
jgi:hypothetical protein